MDDEPPVLLAYQPYKGPAAIPHVGGEFFGAFFLGINVSAAVFSAADVCPIEAYSCCSGCIACIQRPFC